MTDLAVDFPEQLRRQLGFIEWSCKGYDSGRLEEAVRIATSLRVLFHDHGSSSTSLLTHLGRKGTLRLSSTIGLGQPSELDGSLKFFMPLSMTVEGLQAPLTDGHFPEMLSIEDWWTSVVLIQPVYGTRETLILSRGDVIRAAANKDGGAHVDARSGTQLTGLREGLGTFTETVGETTVTRDLTNHHFPLLRQFAYEVLNSPDIKAVS